MHRVQVEEFAPLESIGRGDEVVALHDQIRQVERLPPASPADPEDDAA